MRPTRIFRAIRAGRARRLVENGFVRQQAGDIKGARQLYERAVSLNPEDAQAHYFLGIAHTQSGAYAAAVDHLQRALKLAPDMTGAYLDLGNAYRLNEDFEAARDAYSRAATLDPDALLPRLYLAKMYKHLGATENALEHLRVAHRVAPDRSDILRYFVVTLIEAEMYDEALSVAEEAVRRNQDSYTALYCLGLACVKSHRPERAVEWFRRARGLQQDDPELELGLGTALQNLGRPQEALACYERALFLRPDYDAALLHRGLVRLAAGDFEAGWDDYEARLRSMEYCVWPSVFPSWDGRPAPERTVLVYREQGLGDEIMFASCVPEVIERTGHCVLECSPKLSEIFRRSFSGATVFPATLERTIPEAVREKGIDLQVFAGTLPRFFRRRIEEFPKHAGYLKADPESAERWRERLSRLGSGLKVGISWRGGVHRTRRPDRSLSPERLLPILRCSNASFVNLQYDGAEEELDPLLQRFGVAVAHWPEAISDYDQTAALVSQLDLVISVCTAIIHLTGALGRPVWIMAPYSAEWRYGIAGEKMCWYPSARIFRQPALGDWEAVISAVASELGNLGQAGSDTKARGLQ